jgi:hypothetical protein
MARPTIFKPEYVEQVRALSRHGMTDAEMADFLKVGLRTFHRWKLDHPDFAEALKVGKEVADERVKESLYRRACGYTHPAQKIMQYEGKPVVVDYVEHYPPDTVAGIFWLKNRCPEDWRDKRDVEVDVTEDVAKWLGQRPE